MGIQAKLLIVVGIFLAGSISGGWATHKWYQAEMKEAQDKMIADHNAKMKEKTDAYTKLAAQKEKVRIKTKIIRRTVVSKLPTATCFTPADVRVRNEYAATVNGFLAERGAAAVPADPVDGKPRAE